MVQPFPTVPVCACPAGASGLVKCRWRSWPWPRPPAAGRAFSLACHLNQPLTAGAASGGWCCWRASHLTQCRVWRCWCWGVAAGTRDGRLLQLWFQTPRHGPMLLGWGALGRGSQLHQARRSAAGKPGPVRLFPILRGPALLTPRVPAPGQWQTSQRLNLAQALASNTVGNCGLLRLRRWVAVGMVSQMEALALHGRRPCDCDQSAEQHCSAHRRVVWLGSTPRGPGISPSAAGPP